MTFPVSSGASNTSARPVLTPVQPAGFAPPPWGPGAVAPPPLFAGTISEEQKLELLDYWRSVVKRKWAILALGVAVALVATVLALTLTPVFQASTTVLIESSKAKVVSIEEVYSMGQAREYYQTQLEILKSRDVAERTVRTLKLWEHPALDPRRADAGWRDQAMALLGVGNVEKKADWTEEELAKEVLISVMEGLRVTPVRGSQVVNLQFESTDAKLAAQVLNTVAKEYIDGERDERYSMTQQVSRQLQERLADLREKLSKSERALQAYREQRGIVALGTNQQGVAGQAIGETLKSLSEAQGKRASLEGEYQQARAAGVDYASIPTVARSPLVAQAQSAVSAGQAKLAELQQTLGSAHYKVQQADAELTELRATLRRQQIAAVQVLTREYEAARTTEQTMAAALNTARGAVQTVNREEFELAVLDREYQSNRQLYEMFMSRAKETNLAGNIQPSMARVIDKAVPPAVPIKPNKRQIVLVALVLALLAGAIASVLLDRLDNTIKGGDDAEQRLRLPVLASLPIVGNQDRPMMAKLFLTDAHSHFAEGIRTARTGVMLSNLDATKQTLLVTSTLPNEGKTTVSVNLAIAHAQSKRTLLVDADMRRSQVGRALGLPRAAKGLTNLMAGTATVQQCTQLVPDTQLWVMSVGDLPPNPLELLLSNRFREVLAELGEEFEMIIIDSPPVELVSEALVLAPLVTSTVLVVKAMSTPAPLVRKSLTRLQRAGGRMLGVVVNQLDFAHSQKYYGEYGSSTYSYGTYGYAPRVGDSSFGTEAQDNNAPLVAKPNQKRA